MKSSALFYESIQSMKLEEGAHLLKWARRTRGLSQAGLAAKLAATYPDLSENTVLWLIKNIERGRAKTPVEFLGQITRTLNLRDDWHTRVPRNDFVKESGRTYLAHPVPDIRLPLAPSDRATPLRTQFVTDKSSWKRTIEVPAHFLVPGHEDPDSADRYPDLFCDVVEDGQETFHPVLRVGDVLVIRSDLNPELGHLVLVTTRDGRPLRRMWQVRDGRAMLLPLTTYAEPIPVADVATIEGVICGRYRKSKDGPTSSVFWHRGLRLDDVL